ncbi:MAG: hypothetical protein JO113_06085 [Candidatus Eremiobacteraeota bacterium]|nr:hypothetical protein [Candidatus Eremiobacteraeota bacterium]
MTLVLVSSLAAGCGGAGTFPSGSVVNSPGSPDPHQTPPPLVNVTVTVTIPARTKHRAVRPNYVSVNTESVVIQLSSVNGQPVSGVNPTTINTVAHARGCKLANGQTICTATAFGSPGDDVFAVTTYAGTNATGSVLSVGSVSAKIQGGGGVQVNNLSLALQGIIASLQLSLSPRSGKRGHPVQSEVTLTAYDPSGAQIVGPSDYFTPIALAIQGDTVHAFSLKAGRTSGSTLTIAKPTSNIVLSYDGNRRATSVTVAASVDGPSQIGKSALFTLRGKQPPPPVGTIYVLNLGANDGKGATVTEYDGKANGNAAPERTLSLDSKLYARSIAVDASGNLYVGYLDNQLGYNPGDGQPDTGDEVAIFAPGASGNQKPSAVLNSDPKTQSALFPIFLVIDPSGRLVTYGATTVDANTGDAVLTYKAGSSGPTPPEYGFDFSSPSLHYPGPTGLAIDPSNNFYVNGALYSIVGDQYGLYVVSAADISNPYSAAARTIPWNPSVTQLTPGFTSNNSLDQSGEIYIGTWTSEGSGSNTSCQAHTNVYAAGAQGGTTNVPPVRVLTLETVASSGSPCEFSNPLLPYFPTIQIYGTLLFAVDDLNNAVDAFSASANGNVKPSLRIAGSATQLDAPVALVVTSVSGSAEAGPAK